MAATVIFAVPAAILLGTAGAALHWLLDVGLLLPGILISAGLCVWWGDWARARFGHRDPAPFVLDEFAGQWVALVHLPLPAVSLTGLAAVVAGQFLLFRVFDVLKIPPARRLERLPAGWGVLADDLMAGLYANVLGQLAWRHTPLPDLLGL